MEDRQGAEIEGEARKRRMGKEGVGVDLRREMGRGGKRDGGVAGEKIISISVLRRVTALARKKIPVIVPKVQVAG